MSEYQSSGAVERANIFREQSLRPINDSDVELKRLRQLEKQGLVDE